MSTRKVPLVEEEYYHVYNRGNSKQKIFLDDEDRDHFVKLLYLCNSTNKINFREDIIRNKIDAWDFERGDQLVSIGAWVLMPNHFHLYLYSNSKELFPNARGLESVSKIALFVGRVSNAYVKYFNGKYNRTGSLFEGKFKSVHVEDELQAKYLFSYIHLNPIKLIQSNWKEEGINDSNIAINYLNSYKWSSYFDFLKIKRKENILLNIEDFPDYFSTKEKFKKEIFEWIDIKEE
jgi:putative transposase